MTSPYDMDMQRPGFDMIARQMAAQGASAAAGAAAAVAVATPVVGGPVAVGALSLGGSATITVPLTGLTSDAYVPIPILYASAAILGGVQVAGIVSKTASEVKVLVRAPLLAVGAGATLEVVCLRKA